MKKEVVEEVPLVELRMPHDKLRLAIDFDEPSDAAVVRPSRLLPGELGAFAQRDLMPGEFLSSYCPSAPRTRQVPESPYTCLPYAIRVFAAKESTGVNPNKKKRKKTFLTLHGAKHAQERRWRRARGEPEEFRVCYVDGMGADGEVLPHWSAFVNHHSSPSFRNVVFQDDGLFALRRVTTGEELLTDYGIKYWTAYLQCDAKTAHALLDQNPTRSTRLETKRRQNAHKWQEASERLEAERRRRAAVFHKEKKKLDRGEALLAKISHLRTELQNFVRFSLSTTPAEEIEERAHVWH